MKKVYSCLILTIMISCSHENDPITKSEVQGSVYRTTMESPANPENPFDMAGEIHNNIIDRYYANAFASLTYSDLIDNVETSALADSQFISLLRLNYQPLTEVQLKTYVEQPEERMANAIALLPVSEAARASLKNFVNSELPFFQKQDDFDLDYTIITRYESEIISDVTLSANDREVLLTATSIIRFTVFKKKKPKRPVDHDWDINVTHMAGAIEGAGIGLEEAIIYSVASGIAEN